MNAVLGWLQRRAENVAVGLLTAMFAAFVLQIVSRYIFNRPISWTLELSLTTWMWVVFWGSAFCLKDKDHVRFDMLEHAARPQLRRLMALVSALAIVAGFAASLPATIDYITFYKIKSSAVLHIRLDYVFSIYGIFMGAIIIRYGLRAWRLIRGTQILEDTE